MILTDSPFEHGKSEKFVYLHNTVNSTINHGILRDVKLTEPTITSRPIPLCEEIIIIVETVEKKILSSLTSFKRRPRKRDLDQDPQVVGHFHPKVLPSYNHRESLSPTRPHLQFTYEI